MIQRADIRGHSGRSLGKTIAEDNIVSGHRFTVMELDTLLQCDNILCGIFIRFHLFCQTQFIAAGGFIQIIQSFVNIFVNSVVMSISGHIRIAGGQAGGIAEVNGTHVRIATLGIRTTTTQKCN